LPPNTGFVMPRVSKLFLPPIDWGKESMHPNVSKTTGRKASRKVRRRLEQIEALPGTQQSVLLKTIDTFLEKAPLKSARRA
jgi:hypothetical protein